eukprot:c15298_g1_i3.p1 GENE.c15298_g1_i3~~c15298_g1_i3.p1  ORF type:complete len:338 (+),score=63.68 c15298_g1_i3:62-1075(+)
MPEKRKFPANLVVILMFFVGVAEFSFCFSFFIEWAGYSFESVWCENSYTPETRLSSWCAVQTIIFMTGGKGAFVCWLLILFNLYLVIAKGQRSGNKYEKHCYIFICVYPTILTICAIATQKIGYSPGTPICFIVAERNGLYLYLFFFADLFFWVFFATILTLSLIFRLGKTKMKMISARARSTLFSVKIVLLLIYVFVTFVCTMYLRFEASVNEDAIAQSVTEYEICLFEKFGGSQDVFNDSSSNPSYFESSVDYSSCDVSKPNFMLTITAQSLQCTVGLCFFLLFGIGGIPPEHKIMLWLYKRPIIGRYFFAVMGYNGSVTRTSKSKKDASDAVDL